jgi:hypothetical protein
VTEREWLECGDPYALIAAVPHVSQRKGKLFVVACCRQQESVFQNRLNRKAILAVEDNADGVIGDEELRKRAGRGKRGYSIATACSSVPPVPMFVILATNQFHDKSEQAIQCRLLRDIFGNPFRPIAINTAWLTPIVSNLATVAYEQRNLPSGELDTARLAVLADALEDAGCTNVNILGHLRSSSVHVRGCWALDLLLGKE